MSPLRSPASTLLVLVALVASGCLAGDDGSSTGGGDDCPASGNAPPAGERQVEVQVANHQDAATCVRVLLDGTLVAAVERAGEDPALHANPSAAASFTWAGSTARVRVEDATSGLAVEKVVDVPSPAWIVVRVHETEIQVTSHAERPLYE